MRERKVSEAEMESNKAVVLHLMVVYCYYLLLCATITFHRDQVQVIFYIYFQFWHFIILFADFAWNILVCIAGTTVTKTALALLADELLFRAKRTIIIQIGH